MNYTVKLKQIWDKVKEFVKLLPKSAPIILKILEEFLYIQHNM